MHDDQKHQTIVSNNECAMLRFLVYSNLSSDLLFLIVQEGRIKLAEDCMTSYVENTQDNCNKTDFNDDSPKTDIQYRNTPLFINLKINTSLPFRFHFIWRTSWMSMPSSANSQWCKLRTE